MLFCFVKTSRLLRGAMDRHVMLNLWLKLCVSMRIHCVFISAAEFYSSRVVQLIEAILLSVWNAVQLFMPRNAIFAGHRPHWPAVPKLDVSWGVSYPLRPIFPRSLWFLDHKSYYFLKHSSTSECVWWCMISSVTGRCCFAECRAKINNEFHKNKDLSDVIAVEQVISCTSCLRLWC